MKEEDCKACKVHILVCTNERPPDKSSCAKVGGKEFYALLKNKLKAEGLQSTHWATRTGCLGFCNDVGTAVTIYRPPSPPQWYSEVTEKEFDIIWQEIVRE